MRRYYSLAVAALVLGCTDDGSKTTAPQLAGAVVGGTATTGHDEHGSGTDTHDGGQKLNVVLLKGDNEVPPRDTHAAGTVTLKLNDQNQVDYVLDVANITNITQAHIHMVAPDQPPLTSNGGIVVWLFPSVKATAALPGGGGPVARILVAGTFSAVDFRGTLAGKSMADFIAAVEAGLTYGNVHTDDGVAPANTGAGDFPGGEIRGQLGAGSLNK